MSDQNAEQPELTPQEQKILSESPADSPNIIDDDTAEDATNSDD
jgi:hypothetical protein